MSPVTCGACLVIRPADPPTALVVCFACLRLRGQRRTRHARHRLHTLRRSPAGEPSFRRVSSTLRTDSTVILARDINCRRTHHAARGSPSLLSGAQHGNCLSLRVVPSNSNLTKLLDILRSTHPGWSSSFFALVLFLEPLFTFITVRSAPSIF